MLPLRVVTRIEPHRSSAAPRPVRLLPAIASGSNAGSVAEHDGFCERIASQPVCAVQPTGGLTRREEPFHTRPCPIIDDKAAHRKMGDRSDTQRFLVCLEPTLEYLPNVLRRRMFPFLLAQHPQIEIDRISQLILLAHGPRELITGLDRQRF